MKKKIYVRAYNCGSIFESITLSVLEKERSYYQNHGIELHLLEILLLFFNADTKKQFTLEEAEEVLISLDVNIEADVKKTASVRVQDKGVNSIKCKNCGHFYAWHVNKRTCCDVGCDCFEFRL